MPTNPYRKGTSVANHDKLKFIGQKSAPGIPGRALMSILSKLLAASRGSGCAGEFNFLASPEF